MTSIYTATEDILSEAVANRLINETNGTLRIAVAMGRRGNTYLQNRLQDFIQLSRSIPVLMLMDLDLKHCPSELLDNLLNNRERPETLLIRVVVREIESWLLADRDGFSQHFGIPIVKVPREPESIVDPKQALLNLIFRYSSRSIRQDIVRNDTSGPKQGLNYNSRLGDFANHYWSPSRATVYSQSLAQARIRIAELAQSYTDYSS